MTFYEFSQPGANDAPVFLTQWRVLRIEGDDGTIVELLAGRNGIVGDGRLSTPLITLDAANRTAVTQSGRHYNLGSPGFDPDSEYVMQCRFGALINAGRIKVTDVTARYLVNSDQQM